MSEKLQLPSVTLCCVDCLDVTRAIKVLEICKSKVDFGAVKLLTSIPNEYEHSVKIMPLNSLIAYSIFMLSKVHEFIETEHFLVVQRDGWILNTSAWDDKWLTNYDYIGPLFIQYSKVGSGGFSLRTKKIMEAISKTIPCWDGTQKHADEIQKGLGYYEDGEISLSKFGECWNIAPPEEACKFAQGGNRDPRYFYDKPFGFHRTWQEINFQTGIVDSSDLSKDLHVTYDSEIDSLV